MMVPLLRRLLKPHIGSSIAATDWTDNGGLVKSRGENSRERDEAEVGSCQILAVLSRTSHGRLCRFRDYFGSWNDDLHFTFDSTRPAAFHDCF